MTDTPQSYQVVITPTKWRAELQAAFNTQIAELRHTLRSIEDGSFLSKADQLRPGAVMQFRVDCAISSASDTASARAGACNKCFHVLVKALITYLDRMIALMHCVGDAPVPPNLSTAQEIVDLTNKRLEDAYREVSSDSRLTNPKKLERFIGLPIFPKAAMLSYFQIRRHLEHHSGIPNQNCSLHLMTPTVFAGDHEITSLPYITPSGGSAIKICIEQTEKNFHGGAAIALTEEDIESIYFTVNNCIIPEIERTLTGSVVP